jgi:hypothetical protein
MGKMTEEEMKKYSYEELLNMYLQLKEEMEKRGLYEKYLEEKGAGAIELDKAVKKSFEDLYIPMTEVNN